MKICKTFYFDAAHHLPNYDGKCRNKHGHRWRLDVEVEGSINPETGMVMDFSVLKKIVEEKVIEKLDHQNINGFIELPTAENMLILIKTWLWGFIPITRLRLYETPDSYAEWEQGGNK